MFYRINSLTDRISWVWSRPCVRRIGSMPLHCNNKKVVTMEVKRVANIIGNSFINYHNLNETKEVSMQGDYLFEENLTSTTSPRFTLSTWMHSQKSLPPQSLIGGENSPESQNKSGSVSFSWESNGDTVA